MKIVQKHAPTMYYELLTPQNTINFHLKQTPNAYVVTQAYLCDL